MNVNTRGDIPLPNPFKPSLRYMIFSASIIPRACRISASDEVPRVCNKVLATSSGVVIAAATPPAIPPETMCEVGE